MAGSKTSSGAVAGGGRQRRQAGGRRRAFLVRVTDAEHQALTERAARAGLSVPRLMVEASLAEGLRTVSERRGQLSELAAVKRLALAIGNNVNQLARSANATRYQPRETQAVLEAAARVLVRAEAAVAALEGPGR
jgi:hypothetical protein